MYKKTAQGWISHWDFILIDLLCLNVSFFLAYIIRHGGQSPYDLPLYRNMTIVYTFIAFTISVFFGSFDGVLKRGYYVEFIAACRHVLLVELCAAFYLVSVQEAGAYSRIVLYLMGVIYLLLSFAARLGWKKVLAGRMSSRKKSLLIVTNESSLNSCMQDINDSDYAQFHISGISVLDADLEGGAVDSVPIVACGGALADYLCREWIDEVFINLPDGVQAPEKLTSELSEMGVVVHQRLANDAELLGQKQFVEKLGNYTVLTTSINFASPGQLLVKRLADIVGGVVGVVITALLTLFVAPVILVQSPGPIFFSQLRVGKNGKKFKMYKFRSMYMDAEQRKSEFMDRNRVGDGLMFKLDFDPRIIGNKVLPDGTEKRGFIDLCRRLSIDEWPQFYNVLKGDMSLVGTRPPTVDEWNRYKLHHRARLATKPGITGMWQVSGRSNITDFEQVVALDTEYIRTWSIGLDLRILFKTVAVVFKGEGSM